jgi:hypothetical protein
MGSNHRDLILADRLSDDLAEFEFSFVVINLVSLETAFNIKEDSEVLLGSLDGDDVHVTKRESRVSSSLTVDLDKAFLVLDDLSSLLSIEGEAESLYEEYTQGDALLKLVRTRGRSGGINTLKLSKVPLLRSGKSLQ